MKLTVKQIKAGVTIAYEVNMTLHVAHRNAKGAQSYVSTMVEDWACQGKVIPAFSINSCTESDLVFTNPDVRQLTEHNAPSSEE